MSSKIKAAIREVEKISAAVGGRDTTPAKWMGKWEAEKSYGTLQKVEHLGNSYVCIKNCAGVDPEADVALGNGVQGVCWLLIARKGNDGVSPAVTVTPIANGHRITITDATGQKSFDVMDGEAGAGGGSAGGKNGATFYPYVDTDGNLSWTNDGGLPNPNPVNIMGQPGAPGDPGATGKNATINGVNALTIQGGDGIEATQDGDTLTIKAKTVETWTFTLEDDSTVTKKVVLV